MKFSRNTLQFFYSFAIVGFGLSALIHGATFFGRDPHQHFPNIWMLHVGIFAACIPAALATRELAGSHGHHNYGNLALRYISPGFRYNVYAFVAYALVNFFVCLAQLKFGMPGYFHGQPALVSGGKLIAYLSGAQFAQAEAIKMRLFSGHWMAFYLGAAAMLRSALNASDSHANAPATTAFPERLG